jgi:thiaminase (transcriptional activator TenA)
MQRSQNFRDFSRGRPAARQPAPRVGARVAAYLQPFVIPIVVAMRCRSAQNTQRGDAMSFFDRLKAAASAEWRAYTHHPFTDAMADGSLPEAAFRHYLVQDYLFLIEFARAYALAIYKSPTLDDMREAAAAVSAILDVEMDLHVRLCAGWGLSPEDLQQAPPAAEMLAYTRYVLDTGMRGDLLALKVALAPCVIGYAEIATRLATQVEASPATNPYRSWIAEYAGTAYQEVAAKALAHLERLAHLYATPAREAELAAIFREATRLEADFWEMGWRMGLVARQ